MAHAVAAKPRKGEAYRFEQFAAVRRTFGLTFSPHGREVAYISNTSGQFNAWKQSAQGGWPWQLTTFEDNAVRALAWTPNEELLLLADRHGNELHQIYRLPAAGGHPEQLTLAQSAQHNFSKSGLSTDGRTLAYACNERDPKDMDLKLLDVKSGEQTLLLGGDATYFPSGWSPDGRYLLAVKVNSNTDQDILLVEVQSKKATLLTPHQDPTVYSPVGWAADGSGFYLISDAGRQFKGLAFYDLAKQGFEWVETPEWDVEDFDQSHDGARQAWVVDEDGYSRLYVKNTGGKQMKLPQLPAGVISDLAFSPDGKTLGFCLNRPAHTSDVYLLDLEKGSLQRLTYSMLGGVPASAMVEPELVRFTSFDGRQIPALLYKPKGAGQRVPAVLSIHGGPEAQERPTYAYAGFYQYLLSVGIAILAPNIRGSTGYGKTYQRLIYRDFGGDDLKDFNAAAQYLQSLDWVDGERLGVFGGSYGGFATLSCATRLPQYWAAAVDIVGPANLVTFAKAVPPFWKRFMKEWVGDPDEDHDFLMERSPITYVDQLRCPILIIQGANDPRVVKAESDQMVERLRQLGRDVEYMVFEDEGHGFTKRTNSLIAWKAAADFFEKHLLSPA